MSVNRKTDSLRILLVAAALISAAIVHAVMFTADGEAALRLIIRQTARISLVYFCAAFSASSLLRLWPGNATRWLMRNRRWIGLSFALSHAVHLAAIFRLAAIAPDFEVETITRIFGGLAYVFIALMAATSFDGAVRFLGSRTWRRLHKVGAYYIWFIFTQSYAPNALAAVAYIAPTALLVATLGLRIAAHRVNGRAVVRARP